MYISSLIEIVTYIMVVFFVLCLILADIKQNYCIKLKTNINKKHSDTLR